MIDNDIQTIDYEIQTFPENLNGKVSIVREIPENTLGSWEGMDREMWALQSKSVSGKVEEWTRKSGMRLLKLRNNCHIRKKSWT